MSEASRAKQINIFAMRLPVAEQMVAGLGRLVVVENGLRIYADDLALQMSSGRFQETVEFIRSLGLSVTWFKHTCRVDIDWSMGSNG